MKSRKLQVIAFVVLLVLGAEARGNAPPPPHVKDPVQIRVRFHGLEDYPDYDFYVEYGRPPWVLNTIPVEAGVIHVLPGHGPQMSGIILRTLPHGQKPTAPLLLRPEVIPGSLPSAELPGFPSDSVAPLAGYIMSYRVTIHDGIVEVTAEAAELVAPGEWLGANAITVGVGLAVVIALVGWGFARWRWRPARAAGSDNATSP